MFNSIRTKLIAFVAVVLVVVAAATMGAVLYFFTDHTDSSAKEQARSGVERLNNLLEEAKQDMEAKALILVANPDVIRAIAPGTTVKLSAKAGAPVRNAQGRMVGVISPGVTSQPQRNGG